MRKSIQKIVAGILSATMLLSTSALAFGDAFTSGGTDSNPSGIEDFVDTDVFKVVVPTNVEADTFKFILDPQKLITLTSGAAYNGKKFQSGATLFFMNSGAGNLMSDASGTGTYDYSNKSNRLTIINKSTMDVDVTLSASITSAGDLEFVSKNEFTSSADKGAKVYLGLVNETKGLGSAAAITTEAASDVSLLSGAADGSYQFMISDAATHTYKYALKSDADDNPAFSRLSFYVTGASNPYGDYKDVKDAAPKLDLVWSVKAHSDNDEEEEENVQEAKLVWYEDSFYLGTSETEGLLAEAFTMGDVTSVTLKANDHEAVDVKSGCSVSEDNGYWVMIPFSDASSLGVADEVGTYTMTVVIDGVTYTGSYVFE